MNAVHNVRGLDMHCMLRCFVDDCCAHDIMDGNGLVHLFLRGFVEDLNRLLNLMGTLVTYIIEDLPRLLFLFFVVHLVTRLFVLVYHFMTRLLALVYHLMTRLLVLVYHLMTRLLVLVYHLVTRQLVLVYHLMTRLLVLDVMGLVVKRVARVLV